MTTLNASTAFDRRAFLQASGILAIGFSMAALPARPAPHAARAEVRGQGGHPIPG